MDEVVDLLKTWELPELIPKFAKNGINIQALSALTAEDIKDIIPQIGPRVLFMRCWRAWRAEFSDNNVSTVSLSDLDLSNFELTKNQQSDIVILPLEEEKENVQTTKYVEISRSELINEQKPASGLLENILVKSLDTSSLLIYKGGTLDGDSTRNLLASTIAKEILNEHKNSQIVGSIYFKWANLIKELFPGERTTTYYIPACTTASGAILQARGKLVHQVLNKRRRLQQLGALLTKTKRSREDSPALSTCSSPRSLPISLDESDTLDIQDDLTWLRNSSDPWGLVETKWKNTFQSRAIRLQNNDLTLESYFNEYPALRKPQGYCLLNIDFEVMYEVQTNNLFVYFPVAKNKILEILRNRKSKDKFGQELIALADSPREEDKNLASFLSIPHLLNTTTVKQTKKHKKGESSFTWKPSKVETRDAFIKHLRSDAEIGQAIELRLKTLQNKGATSQPYIIVIGESLKEINNFLVIVNKSVIYQRDNIMQTVDTCYKAFWALNAEYSKDSNAVWYFIQKAFYKMSSNYDCVSTSAESLLTDCGI